MEPAAYPGAEDTHLLLDVLKQDEALLKAKAETGAVCIEIGYGTRRRPVD